MAVAVIRERPSFVEARALRDGETLLLQWGRDSAYRFFPLIEHAGRSSHYSADEVHRIV